MGWTPPLLSSLRYARVNLAHGVAPALAVKLELSEIATPLGGQGPGVTQDEAVQIVADLAWARDVVVNAGAPFRYAAFQGAKWLGTFNAFSQPDLPAGSELVPVVGDSARRIASPPSDGLPPEWPMILSDACDAVIHQIRKSQTSSQIPLGYSIQLPVIAPVIAGIIVGGAAVAVIGGIAAWRYFDPETRTNVKMLEASSQAYRARLDAWKQTGKMPPASEVETNTASAVAALAKQGRSSGFWTGAAVGAGVAGAAAGGALIGKALEK